MLRDPIVQFLEALRGFVPRFDRGRIETTDALVAFAQTRASYVAQTALYGYLKTRMGTSFRFYFEDDGFSALIREATVKLFLSCLADLAVFSVATAAAARSADDAELAALARHCFREAAARGLADQNPSAAPADVLEAFDRRAGTTLWRSVAAEGRAAFEGSVEDLIRFAPVADRYKRLDHEIVTNSLRFRWRDVRVQARRRIDGEAVIGDWRAMTGRTDLSDV